MHHAATPAPQRRAPPGCRATAFSDRRSADQTISQRPSRPDQHPAQQARVRESDCGALTFNWPQNGTFSDISCDVFLGALVTAHLVHTHMGLLHTLGTLAKSVPLMS
eukprot:COSAG01_NODE_6776_length_3502_cov_32.970320_5_plen_106_part_01